MKKVEKMELYVAIEKMYIYHIIDLNDMIKLRERVEGEYEASNIE